MKTVLSLLGMMAFALPAQAVPITLSGAEIAQIPGTSTRLGTQSIIGDALRIDAIADLGNLLQVPLNMIISASTDISFTLQSLRLTADSGRVDQDFQIGIFDGQNVFGARFVDSFDATVRPDARVLPFTLDQSQSGSGTLVAEGSSAVLAPIDSIAEIGISIRSTVDGTEISGSVNGINLVTGVTSLVFDAAADLFLVVTGSDRNENYQFNSFTFTSDGTPAQNVPEPGALAGLALGLLGLAIGLDRTWLRRRRDI